MTNNEETTILNPNMNQNANQKTANNDEATVFGAGANQNATENNMPPTPAKSSNDWQKYTAGGVVGIVLGVAGTAATNAVAAGTTSADLKIEDEDAAKDSDSKEDVVTVAATGKEDAATGKENADAQVAFTPHTTENGLKVADVSDNQTFEQALESARDQVGPGGVFHWHGKIFATYTEDEWDSMTDEQKQHFAEQTRSEITSEELANTFNPNSTQDAGGQEKVVSSTSAAPEAKPEEVVNGPDNNSVKPEKPEVQLVEPGTKSVEVAEVSDSQSFSEAFASAREQVGPGGVFHWRGGIYNTYTKEEWNGMTESQKDDFAELIKPEIRPAEVHPYTPDYVHAPHEGTGTSDHVSNHIDPTPTVDEGSVHFVGFGEYEGHLTAGYDINGDGGVDVVIIDDGDGVPSGNDLVATEEGIVGDLGSLAGDGYSEDPTQDTIPLGGVEDYDSSMDMPDYMNDADMGTLA